MSILSASQAVLPPFAFSPLHTDNMPWSCSFPLHFAICPSSQHRTLQRSLLPGSSTTLDLLLLFLRSLPPLYGVPHLPFSGTLQMSTSSLPIGQTGYWRPQHPPETPSPRLSSLKGHRRPSRDLEWAVLPVFLMSKTRSYRFFNLLNLFAFDVH